MSTRNQNRLVWLMACMIAAATFVLFTMAGRAASGGVPLMPLDDVYIHFQYARSIAEGHPYVYNPGLPPTSGATSFLYPYALAAGYALGFRDLNLGVWAMLVGAGAFAVAIYFVYRAGRIFAPFWPAVLAALAFGLNGAFAWHAMSGMETMLATACGLVLLYGLALWASGHPGWHRDVLIGAVLLAMMRPEGAVGAALGGGFWVLGSRFTVHRSRFAGESSQRANWKAEIVEGKGTGTEAQNSGTGHSGPNTQNSELRTQSFLFLLPLLAIGVQPLVNLLVTGSATASGSLAKSLLSAVAPQDEIIRRILGNAVRMARELFTGWGEPQFVPIVVSVLAVVWGVGVLSSWITRLRSRGSEQAADRRGSLLILLIAWFAGTIALISTLDTAFWHFKRYQMPMLALLFPLAAWGAAAPGSRLTVHSSEYADKPRGDKGTQVTAGSGWYVTASMVAGVLMAAAGLWSAAWWPTWLRAYALNIGYVAAQPYPMAEWLRRNAPEDAVIAVHDVGMMRYHGGRTTLDIVGLTTPGAAEAWRLGPGAVGEFIASQRPDLIANYGVGHGLGLGYFAQTDLYAEPLAEFNVTLDPVYNVALAAERQGIYRPDWAAADAAQVHQQRSLLRYLGGMTLVDTINVGSIGSERDHGYAWRNDRPALGFPSEFFQFATPDCAADCTLMDGGRHINGEESFRLSTRPGQDMILITRVHAGHGGAFDVYVNDRLVGTRALPPLPGSWLEIATYVPGDLISGDEARIRIVPLLAEGDYMPYHHWAYQGTWKGSDPIGLPPAEATYQEGQILLTSTQVRTTAAGVLEAELVWWNGGGADGDWIAFVHVYPEGDDGRVVAQTDRRPGDGTLPPGNWLPGALRDTFAVSLAGVAAGRYRVAVGFYDPATFERLMPRLTAGAPDGYEVTADGRLFIGSVEVR